MIYDIQWFPKGAGVNYSVELLYEAVKAQKAVRNVIRFPYSFEFIPAKKQTRSEVVRFTVTGGYPTARNVLMGVNDFLQNHTHSSEEQRLIIKSISTGERKHNKVMHKIKRCRCKK